MDFLHRLSTIIAINVTPFHEDLQIDLHALGRNLDQLLAAGMTAVTPCGNTGEFNSLSVDEWRSVTKVACERLCKKATVIVGVGYDVRTACTMTEFAATCGADAVMVHHPPHPFLTTQGYVDYIRQIARAAPIGVIPYVRAANISDAALLAATEIDNVCGVKFAVNDLQRFGGLVARSHHGKPIAWICGTAELWAPFFWAAGAVGFTSGLVNVAPKLSQQMMKALREGTGDVKQIWALLKPFEDLRARNNSEFNVTVVKEAMHQLGLANRTVRPPIATLPDADRDAVAKMLTQWKEYM